MYDNPITRTRIIIPLRRQNFQRLNLLPVDTFKEVDALDVLESGDMQRHTPGARAASSTRSQLEHTGHGSKRAIIEAAILPKISSLNKANAYTSNHYQCAITPISQCDLVIAAQSIWNERAWPPPGANGEPQYEKSKTIVRLAGIHNKQPQHLHPETEAC